MERKGFTLIELLVVIGIIIILSAILFPFFARARENARRASCLSNLKQIDLAMLQYTQDYDERFPNYVLSAADGTAIAGWTTLLQAYIKNQQIFQCPSEPTPYKPFPQAGYSDYGYNLWLGWQTSTPPAGFTGNYRSLSSLTQPSLTVSFCDLDANNGYATGWSTGFYWYTSAPVNCSQGTGCVAGNAIMPHSAGIRHLDGQNFAFTDGHVKWYKGTELTRDAGGTTYTYSRSMVVYDVVTPGSTSGNSPTFNPAP